MEAPAAVVTKQNQAAPQRPQQLPTSPQFQNMMNDNRYRYDQVSGVLSPTVQDAADALYLFKSVPLTSENNISPMHYRKQEQSGCDNNAQQMQMRQQQQMEHIMQMQQQQAQSSGGDGSQFRFQPPEHVEPKIVVMQDVDNSN